MLALTAGVAGAFPEGTVGQPADHEGTVTRVVFVDDHEGWNVIMPYRGEFSDDGSHLVDGMILNICTHDVYKGHVFVYKQAHESHPTYTGEKEEVWGGSWEMDTIVGGQYFRDGSGKQ